MMIYAVAGLAFLAIAGLGIVFTGGDDGARKRAKAIGSGAKVSGKGRKTRVMDEAAQRRKKNQAMLDALREQNGKRQKNTSANDIKSKLAQAGIEASPTAFWIFSIVVGVLLAALIYVSGIEGLPEFKGIALKNRPILVLSTLFVGVFGVPRFLLGTLIKRRHKKLTSQFADAIDIIVRGVKSGLPLNECLRIIARESPRPLGQEFETLSDSLAMGTNIDRALQKFYKRVPLPEVNFFVIVLTIQSKSGGNLSEALGNLSIVIRSRKMMREKIKALSSEAKASAMIIGCLPFAVAFMVYLTTPDYIMELFRKETGHFILVIATTLMGTGIAVMKKMISFDI